MSSKIQSFFPWQYKTELDKNFFSGPGLFGFCCADPYVSKIVSKHLLGDQSYQVKTADEISREWFEDTIGGYDLFSSEQSFLIMNGDDLKNPDYFFEERIEWGENKVFILFKNDKKAFKSFAAHAPSHFFKVSPPKPWQADRLIEFYLGSMNLSLDRRVVEYLSETLPFESALYMNAIKTLFLHMGPERPLDVALAKELISAQKLDYFKMADLWMGGRRKEFFQILLPLPSFDELMKLSIFMQGHLLKLIDPSYMDDKPKPNQYDRKILQNSTNIPRENWKDDLREFANLEILAKQKSSQIESFIKKKTI